ncbi:hypothetical protein [Georgenia sp. SUBG003]|uniref:hypothetical protein n=1 Tax=Georgenia sp. SUBG003 TaxID=1497974 RepID=UPI003AB5E90A
MDQDTVGDTVGETVEQTVEFLTIVLWVGGGIVAGLLAAIIVAALARVVARGRPIAGFIRRRCRRPLQLMLATIGAWIGLVIAYPVAEGAEAAAPLWRRVAEHGLLIVEIAAVTWFVTGLVRVAEDMVLARGGRGCRDHPRPPGADAVPGHAPGRRRRRRGPRRLGDPAHLPRGPGRRGVHPRLRGRHLPGRRPGRPDDARQRVRRPAARVHGRHPRGRHRHRRG